jgi:hypothetical protein
MTKIFSFGIFLIFALSLGSCDKVDNPIKPSADLDSTLFPGDWNDYVVPLFTANTNTTKNVLIEDYTGHLCGNCPDAGVEATNIEGANPERIYVASVHASPSGLSPFQAQKSDCGTSNNPDDKYCTILYCDEGVEYGQTFGGGGFGFVGNPQGNVNRKSFGGDRVFQNYANWATLSFQALTENLQVNIQAKSNYYPETRGLFLHTETEFLADLSGNYAVTTYLIENEVIDYQLNGSTDISDYHHHNVFRGCLDGQAWGRVISGSTNTGDKINYDYSYQLPSGQTNSEFHVLIYVYDLDTYEILQVIKHEF